MTLPARAAMTAEKEPILVMHRAALRLLALLAMAASLVLPAPRASAAEGDPIVPPDDAATWMFDPATVVRIALTIPEASRTSLAADPSKYVNAGFTMTHGAQTWGPWTIKLKLKGRLGSFRDLSGKAAFKLKFSNAAQRVAGLEKLTLNNMVQDPSKIHEVLAYELFRGMGIPAPRTGYAVVTVDGVDFGLYLNVESMDLVALERWYGADGTKHLYEGSYGLWTDVEDPFNEHYEVDEGDEDDRSDLAALLEAGRMPDDTWLAAVDQVADLRQLARMWAVERYIGHWDGYSDSIVNNYYWHSSADGVFTMLPWGTDQTFSARLDFDAMTGGRLFNRAMAEPSTRAEFAAGLAAARETAAALGLAERAEQVFASIADEIAADTRAETDLAGAERGKTETVEFLDRRPREVAEWESRSVSAPQGLSVRSGSRRAALAWQPSTPSGPASVTGYRIRYRQGRGAWRSADVPGWASIEREVAGLVDGHRYEFRIAAITTDGNTRPSRSVSVVAGAPWAVGIDTPRRGVGRITVAWLPPDFAGEGRLAFDVESRREESPAWRPVVADHRAPVGEDGRHFVKIPHRDAPPGTRIRVRARNDAGAGPWAVVRVPEAAAPPPAGVTGIALWLDASRIRGAADGAVVDAWYDVSGSGRDAVRTYGSPRFRSRGADGRPVVEFPGSEASFAFPRVSNIRTVFWVVRRAPGYSLRFLLGDDAEYHFHASEDGASIWDSGYAHPAILGGTTKLMGAVVDGTATAMPEGALQLISLVTTGDVQASTLSEDRDYGRSWVGDVAEVLIYDRALSPEEEAAVGAALAEKHGLTTSYAAKSAR